MLRFSPLVLLILLAILEQGIGRRYKFLCPKNKEYNAGQSQSDEEISGESSKGNDEPYIRIHYLYDNKTEKCYEGNSQGPCSQFKLFTQLKENSDAGTCIFTSPFTRIFVNGALTTILISELYCGFGLQKHVNDCVLDLAGMFNDTDY